MAPLLPLEPEMLDPPNLRMSSLLRSGMSLALDKMSEEKKEFQQSVTHSLQNSPNRLSASKYNKYNFSNCNYLFQSLQDALDANHIRLQIGSIETIKQYADETHLKVLRQQARCAVYLVKRYLGYLRLGVENLKKQREKNLQAQLFHSERQRAVQAQVFRGMRQVIDKEAKWLEAVREEFGMQLLERTLGQMKQFVKISKCERNHENNIKNGFFKVLNQEVEARNENGYRVQEVLVGRKLK